MKFLLSIFLLAVFAASCTRQDNLTNEEVVEVIRRFDDGWRNKELSSVDAVLGPSYTYFTQSGGIFSRANLVETAGSPEYSLKSTERKEFHVQLYGNTAVVSTRWLGKGIYKGVPFNEDQRCSIIIIKHDNKVQILSEHCTPIKPAKIYYN